MACKLAPGRAAGRTRANAAFFVACQAAASGKMSSKKRKRMDNYVDKKLQKDRRTELFKSLA